MKERQRYRIQRERNLDKEHTKMEGRQKRNEWRQIRDKKEREQRKGNGREQRQGTKRQDKREKETVGETQNTKS